MSGGSVIALAPVVALTARSAEGFTLIEVLVATSVLAVAAAGVASLVTLAASSVRASRAHTWATLLAGDKLEYMRALQWSDLSPSPGNSLRQDVDGYVEYLDAVGRGMDPAMQARAVYVRRWNIQPLPADPASTVILQVLVLPAAQRRATLVHPAAVAGAAVITSLRTRKES